MFLCKNKNYCWCYTCTKFLSFCKVTFIFSCISSAHLWRTFLRNTLYPLHYLLTWRIVPFVVLYTTASPSIHSVYIDAFNAKSWEKIVMNSWATHSMNIHGGCCLLIIENWFLSCILYETRKSYHPLGGTCGVDF